MQHHLYALLTKKKKASAKSPLGLGDFSRIKRELKIQLSRREQNHRNAKIIENDSREEAKI